MMAATQAAKQRREEAEAAAAADAAWHQQHMTELRAALAALGFLHSAWNWCVDKPQNNGSAVFSRHRFHKVAFGLQPAGLDDP